MATKPNNGNINYNIPTSFSDTETKLRPDNEKLITGFTLKEKPNRYHFNWKWDFVFRWFKYFDIAVDEKQNTITGAATTVVSSDLTTSRVLVSDSNGKISASSITSTILEYLSGVTSSIQAQINGKANLSGLASQVFFVSIATLAEHAVRLGMLTGVFSANGYISIPIWDGVKKNIIIQWGSVSMGSDSTTDITLPITYPNAVFAVYACGSFLTVGADNHVGSQGASFMDMSTIRVANDASACRVYWLTIGY